MAAVGDASAAQGHTVSAREAYLRATTYYHVAYFPLFGKPVDPRLAAAFERETTTFGKAAALFDPPIEVLEIPFAGTTLPAYLVKADDSGARRPTVLHTNGYDSNVQEMYFAHAPAATRRGYHCLLFDGPGQGRPLIRDRLTMRPDWETIVRPVAGQIACPTLLTAAEGDPIASGAPRLYEALRVPKKALVRFTAAEGAGGHCEGLARTLYHQRVFDWLDETLDA